MHESLRFPRAGLQTKSWGWPRTKRAANGIESTKVWDSIGSRLPCRVWQRSIAILQYLLGLLFFLPLFCHVDVVGGTICSRTPSKTNDESSKAKFVLTPSFYDAQHLHIGEAPQLYLNRSSFINPFIHPSVVFLSFIHSL